MTAKRAKAIAGASLLTILSHAFCCILPLTVVIGGISGFASIIEWFEPLSPYLLGLSFVVLAYSFYQEYKPKTVDCHCEDEETHHGHNKASKAVLWLVTCMTFAVSYLHYFTDFFGHTH